MKLLTYRDMDGTDVYVNPSQVAHIRALTAETCRVVFIGGGTLDVEVAAKAVAAAVEANAVPPLSDPALHLVS